MEICPGMVIVQWGSCQISILMLISLAPEVIPKGGLFKIIGMLKKLLICQLPALCPIHHLIFSKWIWHFRNLNILEIPMIIIRLQRLLIKMNKMWHLKVVKRVTTKTSNINQALLNFKIKYWIIVFLRLKNHWLKIIILNHSQIYNIINYKRIYKNLIMAREFKLLLLQIWHPTELHQRVVPY